MERFAWIRPQISISNVLNLFDGEHQVGYVRKLSENEHYWYVSYFHGGRSISREGIEKDEESAKSVALVQYKAIEERYEKDGIK